MSRKLNKASAIAVAVSLIAILAGANGSGAVAQSNTPAVIAQKPELPITTQPVIPALPAADDVAETAPKTTEDVPAEPVRNARSLATLVSAQPQPSDLSRELGCLAGAVYFEAKSETLPGQLAVGRVVVARSKSGRFPNSYCGVVFQRSQFSFVRGNAMPGIDKRSRHWKNAVAIAQIAHTGSWQSPVEGALYFHARRVAPGWRLTRIGQIDNHVFYR